MIVLHVVRMLGFSWHSEKAETRIIKKVKNGKRSLIKFCIFLSKVLVDFTNLPKVTKCTVLIQSSNKADFSVKRVAISRINLIRSEVKVKSRSSYLVLRTKKQLYWARKGRIMNHRGHKMIQVR